MISCRIVMNELPDTVIDRVLCVDEIEESAHWKLVRSGQHRRTFEFIPKLGGPSWFDRWGFWYSMEHFKRALRKRDEATVEWVNTEAALHCGLPAMRYRMLGRPRLLTGSLDTLLVTEYLHEARDLHEYFADSKPDDNAVEQVLSELGAMFARMHGNLIAHRNLTLGNVLIQYEDPTRLTLLNWQRMRQLGRDDSMAYEDDLLVTLRDLSSAGLDDEALLPFLRAYGSERHLAIDALQPILRRAHA